MKELSVIIPSYNVEAFLSCTLDSFLSCKELSNIEIIIVNDGSKDKTPEIANNYCKRFPDTIVLINKANGGHGSTINSGLKVAKGNYVIVVDGDDWVDSEAIDDLIKQLSNLTADVVISGHYRNYVDNGTEEKRDYKEPKGTYADITYLLKKGYQIPMTDICYKVHLLRNIDLQIQEKTFYVDEEFCTIPFIAVKDVVFSGVSYYHYRLGNANQSVSIDNIVNRIDHRQRVFNRLLEIYNTTPMQSASKLYFARRLQAIILTTYLIYYVYYGNKKEGRLLGNDFYHKLTLSNKDLAIESRNKRLLFLVINYLHFSKIGYEKLKQIIK
jgi:glycosyltransferase involved in cell wall biosynthesis